MKSASKHGIVFEQFKKNNSMKRLIFSFLFFLVVATIYAQVNKTEVLQGLEKNKPSAQEKTIIAILKTSSRLFSDKNDLTSVILVIPIHDTVDVLGSDSTYLHVAYGDDEGYIFKRHAILKEIPVYNSSADQPEQVQQVQQPQQQQEQQVSRFTYLENKYGTSMAARLYSGKIWRGMTAEMVRDSWGNPIRINRAIRNELVQEEWIYGNTWLFIENNNLIEWGPIKK
jgi:hypothetical protein